MNSVSLSLGLIFLKHRNCLFVYLKSKYAVSEEGSASALPGFFVTNLQMNLSWHCPLPYVESLSRGPPLPRPAVTTAPAPGTQDSQEAREPTGRPYSALRLVAEPPNLRSRLLGWKGHGLSLWKLFGSGYKEELGKQKVAWPCASLVAYCNWWMGQITAPPLRPTTLPPSRYSCLRCPESSVLFLLPSLLCSCSLQASSMDFPGHNHLWPPNHLSSSLCTFFLTKWTRKSYLGAAEFLV